MTLVAPPGQKGRGNDPPWRIAAKVKADYSAARLEQIEVSFGPEERALKLAGQRRHQALARRRCCARRCRRASSMPTGSSPGTMPPSRFARCRRCGRSPPLVPHLPIPAQIELASEQVMLGGRPLQDIAAELHGDDKSWSVRRLEFRAPGTTRVSLSDAGAKNLAPDRFQGRAQRRIVRSRCAADLAAGPRRYRLSQPEAASAARRRDRGAGRLCHRRHEGRHRRRHGRGAGAGIAQASRSRLRGSRRT